MRHRCHGRTGGSEDGGSFHDPRPAQVSICRGRTLGHQPASSSQHSMWAPGSPRAHAPLPTCHHLAHPSLPSKNLRVLGVNQATQKSPPSPSPPLPKPGKPARRNGHLPAGPGTSHQSMSKCFWTPPPTTPWEHPQNRAGLTPGFSPPPTLPPPGQPVWAHQLGAPWQRSLL